MKNISVINTIDISINKYIIQDFKVQCFRFLCPQKFSAVQTAGACRGKHGGHVENLSIWSMSES